MKLIITAKTEKGDKSSEKEIDRTVDEIMNLVLNIKGKIIGGRCYQDGSSVIIRN